MKNLTYTPKKAPIILIAPLDWGLGHATRCIPIIKHLISLGCEVIIATDGPQQILLEQEFPGIKFVFLPGYKVRFSSKTWKTILKILWQVPNILTSIRRERLWLQNFLLQNKIDAVISDNRYGLSSNQKISVIITHQLTIKTPFGKFFERNLHLVNYRYLQKFNECWVPDFEGKTNMGGELSHPERMPVLPVKFLGRLSRINQKQLAEPGIELLIILSGPEPQRSVFEEILLNQLTGYLQPAVLVRGLPGEKQLPASPQKNLRIYNYLDGDMLGKLMGNTTYIISRSGYSTVMDLMGFHKKCIFVPTPGQAEQEYLANYLCAKKFCLSFTQHNFSLDQAIEAANITGFQHFEPEEEMLYQKIVTEFVKRIEE